MANSQVAGTDPGTGISGYGTTLDGASTGVIGMINRINVAGAQIDLIDVSTANSPGKWKQFIAGMKDAREIQIELVYHKSNMSVLLAAFGGANEEWTITFPDGSTLVSQGFINGLGTSIPFNDKITQSVTLKLSGPSTFYEGSGA